MKDYYIVFVLSIVVLLSCGGGGSDTPKLLSDSIPSTTILSTRDSLQNILNQLLADTSDFSKFPFKDKYSNVILWYEDSIVRLVRMLRKPNDEGVEVTTPDYLFFDKTGTLFAFQVDYGSSFVSTDSVFSRTSGGFVQAPIYGRGVPYKIVDPILNDYKYQSLRFLEIYVGTNINFQFSLHSFHSEFQCEAVKSVNAYTETDRSSEYFTLEPGQLPFHYICDKKDGDGFPWIEIRIPTPDPVDNELLYIPADKFFSSVSYEP